MTTFQECLIAAQRIVAAEARLYNNVVAFAIDVSTGGETTSTDFEREGTSDQQKQYNLPSGIASLINQNAFDSQVPTALSSQQISFLTGLMGLIAESVPGLSTLQNTMSINPTSYTGDSTVGNIAQRDPFGGDYEANTQALYERGFDVARSRAMSGPTNVRGGQARQGFDLADTNTQAGINRFREVNQAQRQDVGAALEASQIANAIEMARRGTSMNAQGRIQESETQRRGVGLQASPNTNQLRNNNLTNIASAAEFLGAPSMRTTDNLRGKGNQNTNTWGASVGPCCFIMLEALNGELPWFVRVARDELGTEATRTGYRRMAAWLVPLMRRSPLVKLVVNWLMIKPLVYYGAWHYSAQHPGKHVGLCFYPVKQVWFSIWNYLGKD